MRTSNKHNIKNVELFKKQLLFWSQQFDDVVWLDSNNFNQKFSNYDAVLAVDAFTSIQSDFYKAFDDLKEYQNTTKDWIFGYLSYDLKNDVEDLQSNNFDGLQFPDLYFFQPKKLFLLKENVIETLYVNTVEDELEEDLKNVHKIKNCLFERSRKVINNPIKIKLRIHKDEYFEKIEKMQSHIHRGDIYEANFCQEFYAEDTSINPFETYQKLNSISNPPFATFLKCHDKYVLSASLERYLKKEENKVISQPIKGTAKRSESVTEDEHLKQSLQADEKEKSENIMIVDLVRNDLSKLANKGTVRVEELCKVYSFKQVHQMISTIVAEIKYEVNPIDILKATFPMGSMTGAPKISAMKIIENLEETKRGVYSGAIGYFSPKGDFDFNVVIRSILYNKTNQYVSYTVGGAITAKSDPLKEYEECLVKAKAMRTVLEN
ncbi:aminodeoxychorismate synthase component I [Yeosuana sp. MJ-SS3]|uniref:aminodeoxychorismate synthase n=1 Tax=Gilvirhabdus luticola TaxID=3079858 RepID=A0ABU3U796_9FLAO|nr:aminodeoxychorismate synthase component I [Yeosuana sp. MJ-SS3]MDU8886282.1 aminodeoxychorismate synthase component I [Yeosuana sp. MJ-SS3]